MNLDKLIFSIVYNMTGDYETAKDVVQDINLKFLEDPIAETVTDKRGYVLRAAINHCLNLKKREKRLQYVGTWLPEPIVSQTEWNVQHSKFEKQNLLSYELAFLMEKLSLTERAVYVLREAFDFDHREIAEAINISPENSRQLFKRAKEKVASLKHKSATDTASLELAKKFAALIMEGNTEKLIALFNDDISIIGDGGGKAPAILKPIFEKEPVAQFFAKLAGNNAYSPVFSFAEILSQPAIIIQQNGVVICVQILSIHNDKISQVFAVMNPDKLTFFNTDFKSLSHN